MPTRETQILIVVATLAGIAWLVRPDTDPVNSPESTPRSISEEVVPGIAPLEPPTAAAPSRAIESFPMHVEVSPPILKNVVEPMQEPEISVEEATDPIMPLIPDWLLESGEVLRERVQVDGQWAGRVRSRYAWPNGSQVEVEVTDLGNGATDSQFKSIGFDFELQAEATNGTLRVLVDGDDYVSNLEYSEEDGSGHVQYIVAGRYLMEVQIHRLPLESFQTLEDRDGLFVTLRQYALGHEVK